MVWGGEGGGEEEKMGGRGGKINKAEWSNTIPNDDEEEENVCGKEEISKLQMKITDYGFPSLLFFF